MKDHPYITCRELIDFIADYIDGMLPEASLKEFERHLAVCPSCRAYLDGYKKTISLGKAAMEPSDRPATEAAPEWLVKAVRSAKMRKST